MENRFDFMSILVIFIQRRRAILIHFIFILLASWIYAFFFTTKEYKSEIVFLPPNGESSLSGVMASLAFPTEASSDIIPEQIETIFASKALKQRIIDKFNLFAHYKMEKNRNKLENTLKLLKKSLFLESNEKSGMGFSKILSFTIRAFHTSPDTARQMTDFAFGLLDSAVQAISVDRAHRNRVFVEGQLNKSKAVLDSLQVAMQQFQMKNKAYDIPEQVKMSISAFADLKATILANDIRMQTIKNEFSEETPELAALQKTNQAYKANLSQLESQIAPNAMPSLSRATLLFPQYTNLLRDIEVQTQVILFITKEFEQAKIKESKNVTSLAVVDPALVPEYKVRPKRLNIMGLMTAAYMAIIFCVIFIQTLFKIALKDSVQLKVLWAAVKNRKKTPSGQS